MTVNGCGVFSCDENVLELIKVMATQHHEGTKKPLNMVNFILGEFHLNYKKNGLEKMYIRIAGELRVCVTDASSLKL